MSLAIIASRALSGVMAPEVIVEVHLANGLPAFNIVGLPDTEVRESRDRVRSAIITSGFDFPARRITVNLAPADLPKESGRFDLPIALGILAASRQLTCAHLHQYEFAGELALTGALRPVKGALSMARSVFQAGRAFVVSHDSACEAALLPNGKVYAVQSLRQTCDFLNGTESLRPVMSDVKVDRVPVYPDLSDVKGQKTARLALEIAAAGRHSLLLLGPPGTGKSMLAARLPGILPSMSEQEALESAAILSLGSRGFQADLWGMRPFRSPHHSASAAALIGGGSTPRPGEISLAHHGVLFLDELPEFDRRVLEVLREPLESGEVHISRATRQASFPAKFQLIAAMNPCPCGYLGHYNGRCQCTPEQINRYRAKISGPLLDRIDLHVLVPALPADDLLSKEPVETSKMVRDRVENAYQIQQERQGKANADLLVAELGQYACATVEAQKTLKGVLDKLGLSARSYHRILKVSRTLADLSEKPHVEASHVLQAIQLRRAMVNQ